MNSKKLVSAALGVATIVVMAGAPLVNAQTTSSLQAQIAALLAQIQALQSQLNTSGTTTTTTYNFTTDLTVGSTGTQVSSLQQFLIAKGYLTAVSAPTGYFGSLTQAAVAKFQAANGITPSVGYFGPKTRAFVNSMSTTTTTGGGTTTTTTTGSPMSVSVDPSTPGNQNLAAGAVNTPVLKLDFTAGATPVTVTNLVLTRAGLSQDSDLDNVYLYNGATRLASNLGFNNGAITFSNGAGLFTVPANSTVVITVTVDIDKGGTGTTASDSGHIFQIGLTSASNVTGGTFSGNYPLNSNQFTIASVNNLATVTISNNTQASTTVNAGQTGYLVGSFNVQASNNPVKITSFNFTNVGSVQTNALQNIKLMNGSTQLGATISSLGSGNVATFNLSNSPLVLTSGQSAVISLYADVTGGVGRSFQFSVQQASDVQAVDTTYGVGIGATVSGFPNGGGFPVLLYNVSVLNGGLVTSKDAASPTTYVVAGNTNQILGKFDVLASGDSIKFNELDLGLSGGNIINNLRVVDDQGAQIGTTQNAVSSTSVVQEGTGSLNYIIPANTTRVLTVYGDLPTGDSGTLQVTLGAGASSAQSYTTFSSVTVSPVSANSLQVLNANTNLVPSLNYSLGSPVQAPAGASNIKIGSYTLTAGQVNAVNLTGISILTANTSTATSLRNLRVMNGTTQVGQTQSTVAANTTYSFNSSAPISIAASQSVTLDVYADISSSIIATTTSAMTTLNGWNVSTQSGSAVSFPGSVGGQSVAYSNGGAVTGSLSAGTSQASFLGMNQQGVTVAQYQFTADTNGSENLTQLNFTDSSSSASIVTSTDNSSLVQYQLTDTSGAPLSSQMSKTASGTLSFNLNGSGLAINPSQTVYVNVVANTNQYPYAISGSNHALALTSFQFTNASISTTTNVTSTNIGRLFTVYQNTLSVTGASFSAPNSVGGVNNIVGEFNFTGGSGNMNSRVISLSLSAAGSMITSSTSQLLGLYDSSNPTQLLATSTLSSTTAATFTFTGGNWVIPNGTKTLEVKQLGATNLNSPTNSNGSYQILLQGVTWTDGNTGATDVTPSISTLGPAVSFPISSQNITGLSS